MGRNQLRRGVWVLALLTCFAVAGNHNAFASNNQTRIEAAGWYFQSDPLNPPFNSDEAKFGVTGKYDSKAGRFEYFNTVTGLKVSGKITQMQFHNQNCSDAPPPDAGGPALNAPAVTVSGLCDDSTCNFQMDLVDGGDPGKGNDWVCNVMITGKDKKNMWATDIEGAKQLIRGNIKIRNY